MRKIPKKLLKEILSKKYYKKCIREGTGACQGRITLEHAMIYAGKQINEEWAILPVCEYHHAANRFQNAGELDKQFHELTALTRLFNLEREDREKEKEKYHKAWDTWKIKYNYLKNKYEGKRYSAEV